ncbi:alanine racemase [Geothermobacter hydrogeniphilus]|uniref:Alanine racemase n=1 Tax=Geothermobacter hydrogeniphilus TaxID=1969733 RepID=A0A1X0YBF4_9BACT|nr:alanine racemase [Geothermobacter hydrogeniphilus]ORJ62429.1 alanine racemase [Geothermobacter hydrogeniphilus]
MDSLPATRIEIDLDALRHNFRLAGEYAAGRDLLAVVKADAYGHGAVRAAQTLAGEGAELFGVAHLGEAAPLRQAGIDRPILLFCGVRPGEEDQVLKLRLTPMLFDLGLAERLDGLAANAGIRQPVHLKIDTGMGRVGFRPEELPEVLERLRQLSHLELEGVVSHLALADERDNPFSEEQYACFRACLRQVREAGFSPRWVHLSNSAALYSRDFPECNLSRPGISLYGGLPGPGFADLDLRPVMHVRSSIAQLKQVPAGTGVSYGHRFTTGRPTRLAAVPVGYADGYSRRFSNCGEVLIRGCRMPVVGTVCMNWTLVDVTDLPEVAVGDRVTFLGRDGDALLRGSDLAAKIGTIDYELYCSLGSHNERVYEG